MVITLSGINIEAIIGSWESERHANQRLVINISFEVDEKKAVASDDINDAVDYAKIESEILEKVPNTTFSLIETMNHFVTNIVMSRQPIKWAEVEIIKPDAPFRSTNSVSVKNRQER